MDGNLSKYKAEIKRGSAATSVGILKGGLRQTCNNFFACTAVPGVGLETKSLSINAFGERRAPVPIKIL